MVGTVKYKPIWWTASSDRTPSGMKCLQYWIMKNSIEGEQDKNLSKSYLKIMETKVTNKIKDISSNYLQESEGYETVDVKWKE